MRSILLVEPDYRSKFPPLGLMRLSTFHKLKKDKVVFVRGKVEQMQQEHWDRIYVSSLFTYELPRTLATVKYYLPSVNNESDIIVGGVGATLLPEYIRNESKCTIITGPLDNPNMIGGDIEPISSLTPDYSLIDEVDWDYKPKDTYFCKVTQGCIRKCGFCAVPRLEPTFKYIKSLQTQIQDIRNSFSERQHLVLMDNNLLASTELMTIMSDIRNAGFGVGAKRNGRRRTVDFNQGIDARLIDEKVARELSSISLSPVRLALDNDAMIGPYQKAIEEMAKVGFTEFTNYVMFNFNDTPRSLYERMKLNVVLSEQLGIRITGFPMRYAPIDDVSRRYIAQEWCWRYLRGIQCVLIATHGLVSPNPTFFDAAFGKSYEEFIEILSMPDRYIIHRKRHKNAEAADWLREFRKLSEKDRIEFMHILDTLNSMRTHKSDVIQNSRFSNLIEHYYPNGKVPKA